MNEKIATIVGVLFVMVLLVTISYGLYQFNSYLENKAGTGQDNCVNRCSEIKGATHGIYKGGTVF